MKRLSIFVITLLLFTGCSSLRIATDYDPGVSLSALETYAFVSSKASADTLNDERLAKAIGTNLNAKGYRPTVPEAADFHVRFASRVDRDVPGNFSFGFGVGTFGSHTGLSVGTSQSPTQDEGVLVIDVLDPAKGTTVWHGSATDRLRSFDTPQEREAEIRRLVDAVLETFPVKK